MTGLKSGSGDDLWSDDESADEDPASSERDDVPDDGSADDAESPDVRSDESATESAASVDELRAAVSDASDPPTTGESPADGTGGPSSGVADDRPYVVRRAIRDKSVQFQRDERLTFFVHDDVVEGERELVSDVESALGRDVPKFDVREAVYRAALRNTEDVLDELLAMGYTLDDE